MFNIRPYVGYRHTHFLFYIGQPFSFICLDIRQYWKTKLTDVENCTKILIAASEIVLNSVWTESKILLLLFREFDPLIARWIRPLLPTWIRNVTRLIVENGYRIQSYFSMFNSGKYFVMLQYELFHCYFALKETRLPYFFKLYAFSKMVFFFLNINSLSADVRILSFLPCTGVHLRYLNKWRYQLKYAISMH